MGQSSTKTCSVGEFIENIVTDQDDLKCCWVKISVQPAVRVSPCVRISQGFPVVNTVPTTLVTYCRELNGDQEEKWDFKVTVGYEKISARKIATLEVFSCGSTKMASRIVERINSLLKGSDASNSCRVAKLF